MFRLRNTLIILVILYVMVTFGTAVYELGSIATTSAHIQRTVSASADIALNQVMASDELFNNGDFADKFNSMDVTTVYIADVDSINYSKVNLFETVYKTTDKQALHYRMYGNNPVFNNMQYMQDICRMRTTLGSYNIPTIARLGLLDTTSGVYLDQTGAYLKEQLDNSSYNISMNKYNTDWLQVYSAKKTYKTRRGTETYYLAPTNVGITYVDPQLLQTAFVSNMDLLMRSKYRKLENGLSNGMGVPSSGLAGEHQRISLKAQETVESYNIINDSQFAFVKGNISNSIGKGYTGGRLSNNKTVSPDISYKILDMTNPENASLVRLALGGIPDAKSYSDWLTSLGLTEHSDKYMVVAKITFFADIIVPYKTVIAREWYNMYMNNINTGSDLYQVEVTDTSAIDLHTDLTSLTHNGTTLSAVTGNPLYEYTTYIAIVP